jgi:hypothetical protein
MYGLRGMTCANAVVVRLVAALTRKVSECAQPFRSQECANAIYGMQNLNSETPEVR